MNHKQRIADVAKKIIEQNGVCKGELCKHCPCGSNVTGDICRIESDTDEKSDEAVEICHQWLIDNGYDSQQKEATMKEQKEIKFQDRTRGGHEYRIYTREGMSDEFPLVGEALRECGWDVQCWTKDGRYYNSDDESEFDLIPVESAELEGLTVGDKVYGYDDKITSHDHVREFEIISEHLDNGFWISYSIGLDKMPICYDGAPIGFGNGQQMFYRSKERALASVKSDKNAE